MLQGSTVLNPICHGQGHILPCFCERVFFSFCEEVLLKKKLSSIKNSGIPGEKLYEPVLFKVFLNIMILFYI